MAIRTDRVGELLEGDNRNRKILISPEGVPLNIKVASNGERLTALMFDLLIMFGAVVVLIILLLLAMTIRVNIYITFTIFLFLFFVIRNLYFIHFELAWQGRTPGKKICGIRVINRQGGELTPGAVIARNITREVEIFLPISLLFSMPEGSGMWAHLAVLGWVLILACLPLFNREHLRAGDLIGGTMVIAMPKRALLGDLTMKRPVTTSPVNAHNVNPNVAVVEPEPLKGYIFTPDQLAIYGAFELQVLEEFLRRPPLPENEKLLQEVCGKICKKIDWTEAIAPADVRRFLNDFYTTERAELERGQLFGNLREDKTAGKKPPATNQPKK